MITTTYAPASFTGNNSNATAYVCSFKALSASDLKVVVTDSAGNTTTLTNGGGMTVTLVGNTVEFVTDTAYDNTHTLVAYLAMSITQLVDLSNSGNNDVNIREEMFDRMTLMLQIALFGVSDTAGVPITFPTNDPGAVQVLPSPANRALSFIYFDAEGDMTTYLLATLIQDIRTLLVTGDQLEDVLGARITSVSADLELTQGNSFRLFEVNTTDGDVTITLPADADQTIEVGTAWDVVLSNATNECIFAAGSGVTIKTPVGATASLATLDAGATIVKTAANTYRIFGRLTTTI